MGTQAAFISQKCTVEYCRARSGLMWEKLFRERAFLDALEICRWEAYAAVLVDVAVMIEAKMRPACGPATPDVLADRLTDMVRVNLGRFPVPEHRTAAPGWNNIAAMAALR